jgi:hypothetical protein
MGNLSIVGLSTFLAALIPLLLSVGAGVYSSVRQCNQDASDVEDQLTATLMEIEGRETRIRSVLAADTVASNMLVAELVQIESGADGHFGDPMFKDHTLVSLVNQYNRLIRRVQFPAELTNAAAGLAIDTQNIHPAIETLNITKGEPHAFTHTIDVDLKQIDQQQEWHKLYGPVRRCSALLLMYSIVSDSTEPWKLMRLIRRAQPGGGG